MATTPGRQPIFPHQNLKSPLEVSWDWPQVLQPNRAQNNLRVTQGNDQQACFCAHHLYVQLDTSTTFSSFNFVTPDDGDHERIYKGCNSSNELQSLHGQVVDEVKSRPTRKPTFFPIILLTNQTEFTPNTPAMAFADISIGTSSLTSRPIPSPLRNPSSPPA